MSDVRPIPVEFSGMQPASPSLQVSIDELHYLLKRNLVIIQAKKIRAYVISELGDWYQQNNSALMKERSK